MILSLFSHPCLVIEMLRSLNFKVFLNTRCQSLLSCCWLIVPIVFPMVSCVLLIMDSYLAFLSFCYTHSFFQHKILPPVLCLGLFLGYMLMFFFKIVSSLIRYILTRVLLSPLLQILPKPCFPDLFFLFTFGKELASNRQQSNKT